MEELIDLIATDGPASDISDTVKQILYAKAADRVNLARPYVATSMFNNEVSNESSDGDYTEDQE